MNLTDKVAISPQVMAKQVGEETVLLDLNSGSYFGLDPIGTRIWFLLATGKTVGEACEALLGEYEVEPRRLQGDVSNLLDALIAQGLVAFVQP
jgi:hypothetical protein